MAALPGWRTTYTPIYIELRTLVKSFPPLPEGGDQPLKLPGLKELRAAGLLDSRPLPGSGTPDDDSEDQSGQSELFED